MNGRPARVASPRQLYLAIAALCALAGPLLLVLGPHRQLARITAGGMLGEAALALALALVHRPRPRPLRRAVEIGLLVALGLSTVLPAYFFGPNGAFAALLALILVATGLLAGAGPGRLPWLGGWLAYAAIAGGQAALTFLIIGGALPDHSFTIVIVPGHPMWHHIAGHLGIQGIYLVAFIAGRTNQRRYRELANAVEDAVQAASRREVLLHEARAEYKRALAAGRHGVFTGHTVGGYRLGDMLGRGGMGEVYAGVHTDDGSRAAIKLLRGDRLADADAIERFVAETDVASRVDSPHVARVYATGGPQQSVPFIAMEYLEGENLATLLRAGPLAGDDLRRLAADLTAALSAIHDAGVVHLDVNPHNVVRDADGGWRLIDFGVAQLAAAQQGAGEPAGTLRYLAPERLGSGFADARADLYGACATIYAAASGRAPFAEVDPGRLALAVAEESPAAPGGPEALAAALRVGMAKDPADRFASATELGEALAAALSDQPPAALGERARTVRDAEWQPPPDPMDALAAADTLPSPPPSEHPVAVDEPDSNSSSAGSTEVPTEVWQDAYRTKMRTFHAGIVVTCLLGAGLLALIAREPTPLYAAWAAIAGIVGLTLLHRRLIARRPELPADWLWALIAVLSVGPAYSLGLHSGFASVLSVALFTGGLFRAAMRASWVDRRWLVLLGILTSHSAAMIAIASGVVGDLGNVATLPPEVPTWKPLVVHGLLMGVYATSFAAGRAVDRRHEALTRRAEQAGQEAARQEALLATARAELDRALAGERQGIFTQLTVGDYEVGELLGRGGMGEVYRARRAGDDGDVALKLVRGDRVADPQSLRRFLTEADALRRIDSPYVARVVEVANIDDELPYIAMEYIAGRSLAELLRERDRLTLGEVAAMVRDVCRGLEDVHLAGIVHRDIKPHNVILTDSAGSRWKLVDFGVAKLVGADTTTGSVIVGTPAYMAPEQALGESVDPRTDLYSFCLVLYRALTGRPAFVGDDRIAIATVARDSAPPDPSRAIELPADVVLTLRLGLAGTPADRFASAHELAGAFAAAVRSELPAALREKARALLARSPWSVAD